MGTRIRSSATISAVVLLLALLTLPAAVAVAAPRKDPNGRVRSLSATTAAPDAYEPDDSLATARDITSDVPRWVPDRPGWGKAPYTEAHTIDTASGGSWDEDWVKFTVSGADYTSWSQLSYMIDAYTPDPDVDVVLDVYGPGYMAPVSANATSGEDRAALTSNDDSPWTNERGSGHFSQVSIVPRVKPGSAGTFYVRVRPYWDGASFSGKAGSYTLRIKFGQVTRLSGADRVATAVRISQETFPTYAARSRDASVVVAYGWGYADALAGASLAGASSGPILLTGADHVPGSVSTEILRLGVKGAYVIGGPTVVHDTVLSELTTLLGAGHVKRVAGANRVLTSVAVMNETKNVQIKNGRTLPTTAFIAYADNFPDALALAPMSYYNKVPILLTHKNHLDGALVTGMGSYFADAVIAGSTSVVGAGVANDLVSLMGLGPTRILRVEGSDRYVTAKEIASWSCDLKGPGTRNNGSVGTSGSPTALQALPNADLNAYASGENYPDALAGGALAGNAGAPLLLTHKSYSPPILFGADGEIEPGQTQWFADLANNSRDPILRSYLLGGTPAVTDGCFDEIDNNTGMASR